MLMAGDELLSIIFWCVVAYRACAADDQLCFRARRLAGPRRVQISLFIGLDSSPTHTAHISACTARTNFVPKPERAQIRT